MLSINIDTIILMIVDLVPTPVVSDRATIDASIQDECGLTNLENGKMAPNKHHNGARGIAGPG
jgi:hypothetical protein